MKPDIHIIALGARTPVGLRAESSAAAVRAGISRARQHPTITDRDGEPLVIARDARLDEEVFGWPRVAALAASAIAEVASKAADCICARVKPHVLLSLPEDRPGFSEADARRVLQEVSREVIPILGPAGFEIAGRGHAGALRALAVASERLSSGDAACLVCGAESYLEPRTLNWLEEQDRLARTGRRGGFMPGEAAGAILVASEPTVKRLRLPSLARVRGVGVSNEARTLANGGESLWEGLARAIHAAFGDLPADEAADAGHTGRQLRFHGRRGQPGDGWGHRLLKYPGADEVPRAWFDECQDRGEERPSAGRSDAQQLRTQRKPGQCGDDGRGPARPGHRGGLSRESRERGLLRSGPAQRANPSSSRSEGRMEPAQAPGSNASSRQDRGRAL